MGTSETVEAKNIIIATGSKPSNLPLLQSIKKELFY
jgi:dihydrolipoamide dehydrogenase